MGNLKPLAIKLSGNKKYQRLLQGLSQTAGLRSGYVNLRPGQNVGKHTSDSKEEVIVILSGKAKICFSSLTLAAGANSILYIPPYTEHNVENVGKKILSYIYITSPVSLKP